MPLLVRVLAGNSVTSTIVLSCLYTADARPLRRLHPTMPAVVARVPWCDMDTPVVDAARWRTCFPAAVGACLTERSVRGLLASKPAAAAMGGTTHLDLYAYESATGKLLLCLPPSLRVLSVPVCSSCEKLTAATSVAHLTPVVSERTVLYTGDLQAGTSLSHYRQLRVLDATSSGLDRVTLASLPRSLEVLKISRCWGLTPPASFAHLTALPVRELDVARNPIGDDSLATLPPSLVSLNARGCTGLTAAAVLPHLPELRLLIIYNTGIGDALVASLPATLVKLYLAGCRRVTASATLDHVSALRELDCSGTGLSPAVLAVCRERGCAVTGP